MIQQKIYFTDATYNRMYEDGYLGNANIIFEKALDKEEIFNIGKQSHFYIVDEDLKQRIDKAIEKLKEHKHDLDYEPWSIYQIEGSILFDLVNILKGSDKE